jgi:hypothetical protein
MVSPDQKDNNANKTCNLAKDPKAHCNFGFRPANRLKVVVDR